MLQFLIVSLSVCLSLSRPLLKEYPGYWQLVLPESHPTSGYKIAAGTPFLGWVGSGLEHMFRTVGQPVDSLPEGEYLLETLTEGGFQVS